MVRDTPVNETLPARSLWRNDLVVLSYFFFPAAIVTWGIHELAHWGMGVTLGYDMWITFNQVGLASGSYESPWHRILVSAAGPLVTLIQASVVFIAIRRWKEIWLYPFLFLTAWTRGMAFVISLVNQPNDEARISLELGMPIWVLPAVVTLPLLILLIAGNRELKLGWKGYCIGYVMASLVTTMVVYSDQLFF